MFGSKKTRRGQAVVMVTLALVAMCGLIGLAVDLGWMHYVKKQAQAAADAAAMAAVQEALYRLSGNTSGFTCPATSGGANSVSCQPAAVDCSAVSSSSNLYNGCQYAARNGFTSGVGGSRQNVTIQANDWTTLPPTAPGVNGLAYWVTVRTVQTVPQLFSAILGNTQGTVAARATAAIVQEALPGSVYALNREGDCISGSDCGVDIDLGGSSTITSPGPVIMASGCDARNSPAGCSSAAGASNGSKSIVEAPSIESRGTVPGNWGPSPAPVNDMSDGKLFQDPTTGLSQPPLVATSPLKSCGLLNGALSGTAGPFSYYAYSTVDRSNRPIPTGNPIVLTGNTTFSPTGGCGGFLSINGNFQTSSFPDYFFYGGLNVASNSATFGPGQYVMVGAHQVSGDAGAVFNVDNKGSIQSSGSGSSYPGNMFIFTAPGYPGLSAQISSDSELQQAASYLYQGDITIKGGATTGASLNGVLEGQAPASLNAYNGVLFWQDRRNSTVEYNADGTIANAPATASQLSANLVLPSSPGMTIDAAPKSLGFNGVVYQPRGAWITFQGHGEHGGSLQLITGAILMQGGGDITLAAPINPFLLYVCALIE